MVGNRTYAMIKPHAVQSANVGKIIDRIEREGFKVVAMKKVHFSSKFAEIFYAVHAQRSFFQELVADISSGPVVALILEKENAVQAWRDLIGATDPEKAAEGTIRKQFGVNVGKNAVHGSDSDANAALESALVFPDVA
ncbi:nucleoside-diphosphate kinase [Candidatus Dependentiae bacterium]|nr:nucleoside-diphosphate kinase [Candidatus Dependentiae bacterium]